MGKIVCLCRTDGATDTIIVIFFLFLCYGLLFFFFFLLFSACLHLFRVESCSRMFPFTMYRNTPYMRNTCLKESFSLPRSLGKSKVLEKGQSVSRREMRGRGDGKRVMVNGRKNF